MKYAEYELTNWVQEAKIKAAMLIDISRALKWDNVAIFSVLDKIKVRNEERYENAY